MSNTLLTVESCIFVGIMRGSTMFPCVGLVIYCVKNYEIAVNKFQLLDRI